MASLSLARAGMMARGKSLKMALEEEALAERMVI
jgi:hypothetical protein